MDYVSRKGSVPTLLYWFRNNMQHIIFKGVSSGKFVQLLMKKFF